jgi:hypothetical protein
LRMALNASAVVQGTRAATGCSTSSSCGHEARVQWQQLLQHV